MTSELLPCRKWRRSAKTDNVQVDGGAYLTIQSMVEEHNALVAAYLSRVPIAPSKETTDDN